MQKFGPIRLLIASLLLTNLIAAIAAAVPERSAETLTIVDSDGTKTTFTQEDLRAMPLATEEELITVGQSSGFIGIFDFSGVRLSELLLKATDTASARDYVRENTYLIFKGTDGYQTIATWTELMMTTEGRRALIAVDKDGTPLPALEGRFRLVLPGDKYAGRSVKCLETIEIHMAEGFLDLPKKEADLDEVKNVNEVPRLE